MAGTSRLWPQRSSDSERRSAVCGRGAVLVGGESPGPSAPQDRAATPPPPAKLPSHSDRRSASEIKGPPLIQRKPPSPRPERPGRRDLSSPPPPSRLPTIPRSRTALAPRAPRPSPSRPSPRRPLDLPRYRNTSRAASPKAYRTSTCVLLPSRSQSQTP